MRNSPPDRPGPRPRRYRYSKWRWRVLVGLIDLLGTGASACWRRVVPARPPRPPKRILVIQLDHLGDAILTSPMFPRLKEAFPEAAIDVLASPTNHPVFEADPHVDRVIVAARNWFERRPGRWALASAVWTLGRSLRGAGYDLGFDVRGDLLTVLVLALAGVRRRVGWAMGGGGFLLTDVVPWEPSRHEVRARLALLEALGIPAREPIRVAVHATDLERVRIARRLEEEWSAAAVPSVRDVRKRHSSIAREADRPPTRGRVVAAPAIPEPIDLDRPLVVLHPGAGMAAKRWPLPYWAALASRFLRDGWRVILTGGEEDVEAGRAFGPHPQLRDWIGRLSITETAALLERAHLFVGADSGPAHLAACAGIASVVLFSGTNRARQWRPWSDRALVLRHRVACGPCHQKQCPLADHPCMTGLKPVRVYRAALRWFERTETDRQPLR